MNRKLLRNVLSEFIATFLFIFAICAVNVNADAGASNQQSMMMGPFRYMGTDGSVKNVLCALTAFLSALCITHAFGGWSGAHFNPAVTFGAILGRKLALTDGLLYIVGQLGGAWLSMFVLRGMFGKDPVSRLALAPNDTFGVGAALAAEFLLTFTLVLVVYCVALGTSPKIPLKHGNAEKESSASADPESQHQTTSNNNTDNINKPLTKADLQGTSAPLAIAAAIGALSLLASNVSGGCYNPARATGPALFNLQLGSLWLYWVGDLMGAAAAVGIYLGLSQLAQS